MLGFFIKASLMIGDSESDIKAGIVAGCKTFLPSFKRNIKT